MVLTRGIPSQFQKSLPAGRRGMAPGRNPRKKPNPERNMFKKISTLFVFTMLGAVVALAQNGRGHDGRSPITVAVDGFTCNNNQGVIPALSWSFGVSNP